MYQFSQQILFPSLIYVRALRRVLYLTEGNSSGEEDIVYDPDGNATKATSFILINYINKICRFIFSKK